MGFGSVVRPRSCNGCGDLVVEVCSTSASARIFGCKDRERFSRVLLIRILWFATLTDAVIAHVGLYGKNTAVEICMQLAKLSARQAPF